MIRKIRILLLKVITNSQDNLSKHTLSTRKSHKQCMSQSLDELLLRPYALDRCVWARITRKVIALDASRSVKIRSGIAAYTVIGLLLRNSSGINTFYLFCP